jgi:hypothetical protein
VRILCLFLFSLRMWSTDSFVPLSSIQDAVTGLALTAWAQVAQFTVSPVSVEYSKVLA